MSTAAETLPRAQRIDRPRLPPAQLFGTALQGLRTRRLRAALSALGIAIGIGAMVAVVGVSSSAQANLIAEIDALGTNLLTVTPGQTFTGNTEVLPDTAVAMIDHMANVNSAAAVYQVARRERVPHPARALHADRRDRRRRRLRQPPARGQRNHRLRPLPGRRRDRYPEAVLGAQAATSCRSPASAAT